jgi:hypothetical protein
MNQKEVEAFDGKHQIHRDMKQADAARDKRARLSSLRMTNCPLAFLGPVAAQCHFPDWKPPIRMTRPTFSIRYFFGDITKG